MTEPSQTSTSHHIARAAAGDQTSLAWIIGRFTPLLVADATRLLGPRLRKHCDPEDLVQETWLVTVGKLSDMRFRGETHTPTLLRFFASSMMNKVNNLLRKHISGNRGNIAEGSVAERALDGLGNETTSIVSRAIRREEVGRVLAVLDGLDQRDRDVLLMRGVEQHSTAEVAQLLETTPNNVSQIYRRARAKVLADLPGSAFAELTTGEDVEHPPG